MQVAELLVGIAAPVLYWEQGHEWLFGDPVRFQVCTSALHAPCVAAPSLCALSMRAYAQLLGVTARVYIAYGAKRHAVSDHASWP